MVTLTSGVPLQTGALVPFCAPAARGAKTPNPSAAPAAKKQKDVRFHTRLDLAARRRR